MDILIFLLHISCLLKQTRDSFLNKNNSIAGAVGMEYLKWNT